MIHALVDFGTILRAWDGFGVNYVETAQTPDYRRDPQDYGGFGMLAEHDRQRILEMVFGADGLQPGIIKMFLDPFHQPAPTLPAVPNTPIDQSQYDHTTTTHWMRYFAREGLARTRARGADLRIITTLYGPPGWMTLQGFVRGRDLNPAHATACARYQIAWAKYLRDVEQLPVRYISLHNEGEDYHRWPADGRTPNWEQGHDYNLYWPPQQVVAFLRAMRDLLDAEGMPEVGLTPGETSNWVRFSDWGYADAIADDPRALANLGLITSHGFFGSTFGRWYGDHRSLGTDILRAQRPDLHSWVTSTSWGKMDARFIYEMHGNIYSAKVNAIIPWACVQRHAKWHGGDPNPGTAFLVTEEGDFQVQPGYYFYKQVCRAGQPGMGVARVAATGTEIGLLAFAANGTGHPDAFAVANVADEDAELEITIAGCPARALRAYRTSPAEQYVALGEHAVEHGLLRYTAPAGSVTTFYAV